MRSRVVGVLAVLVLALGTNPVVADAARLDAGRLTVEHQEAPLGVDAAKPRFGWVLTSTALGARQTAYQVQVSSSPNGAGDVWDSGRVSSAKSFDVEYAGPGLQSRTRYHWRVRVWDAAGRASAWTGAAWFETAFLTGTDFRGDWIGANAAPVTTSLQGASWIWYPQGNPADSAPVGARYFRRAVDLPADARITAAHLQLTADDSFTLHVNGTSTASSPPVADSWRTAVDVDLTAELRAGRNVLAVQAANAQPGPSGLVGRLHVELAGANPVDVVTDAAWKSSDYAGFQYVQVVAPADVTVTAVTAQRVHTAVAKTGDFSSSSDLFDRYHVAQANTILNNLHSVPTDTPMYEKRPYTADGFLAADSAIASFDMRDFYENWARAHRDDQTAAGNIGQTVPGTGGPRRSSTRSGPRASCSSTATSTGTTATSGRWRTTTRQ